MQDLLNVSNEHSDSPEWPLGSRPAFELRELRSELRQVDFAEIRLRDQEFMQEALEEAERAAALGEVPVGAVVVQNGKIIARAHNERERKADPSAHAEFIALLAAARKLGRWRLSDCCVYVSLEPCVMCAGLMINARVGRCVYAAKDPKAGCLGSLYDLSSDERFNHNFELTSGVLADKSSELLKDFFRERRQRAKSARKSTQH